MSNKKSKQELVLPPDVTGEYNGYLELKFEGFKWCGNKTFNLIQAKIRFWGQETAETGTIWFNSDGQSEPESLKYRIVTATHLFKSYLQHAEPVQVKLISLKSNTLIGSSAIRIPAVVANLRPDGTGKILATESSLIFSPKGFVLGSIFVTFRVRLVHPVVETLFDEKPTKEMPTTIEYRKPMPLPQDPEIITLKRTSTREKDSLSEFVLNNVPSISSSEYTTTIGSSLKDYNDSQKSSIMNYLTGKDIPKETEVSILKEICKISPAASLIDILSKEASHTSQSTVTQIKHDNEKLDISKSQLLKHIDSIRFVLHGFLATKIGIKEIMKKFTINNMKTFNIAIECQISAGAVKSTDNNTMYFLSRCLTQNDLVHRIEINKQNYRALNNAKQFFSQNNISMTFVLWIRDSISKISYILGASRVPLGQMLKENLSYKAKTAIKLVNSDIVVGVLSFHAELGCRKTIFGSTGSEIGMTCNQENSDSEKNGGNQQNNKTCQQTTENNNSATEINSSEVNGDNGRAETQNKNMKIESGKESEIMNSLLYFGSIKDSQGTSNLELRLKYFDLFTNETVETNLSAGNVFNWLKVFPVIINEEFLNKMKHNYILVEMFQRNSLVVAATIKLPLHQFYIAYRDNDIKSHLSKAKLPVISIDGWNNLISTTDSQIFGQLQVLLAVGTEMQIETLKVTRGLSTSSPIFQSMLQMQSSDLGRTAETQTTPNKKSNPASTQMSNMLSSFIENLANKLPDRGATYPEKVPTNLNLNGSTAPQMRNTADLLEMLQKALTERPTAQNNVFSGSIPTPVPFNPPIPMPPQSNVAFKEPPVVEERGFIRVAVEIECARKLPIIRMSRKNHKKNKGKGSKGGGCDVEPSAYVTFEAQRGQEIDQVRSHEGIVYTTQVVEHSCEPVWHKTFEVSLPADILWNDEKNFILKIWRKSSPADTKQFPTPLQDAVIGFTAVNLRPLLSGVPTISGWYNIMDFSGRNNGQVKVNVRLLSGIPDRNTCCVQTNQATSILPQNETQSRNVTEPLQIETDDNDFSHQLGRALKRKFTELEEISQRLKARLFDITAEAEAENFDPDDEFEHDLNTVVESDEEEAASREDFGWLGQDKAIFTAGLSNDQGFLISQEATESNKGSEMDTGTPFHLSDFETNVNFFRSIFSSSSNTDATEVATTSQGIGHLSEALKETTISDEKPRPSGSEDKYKKDSC